MDAVLGVAAGQRFLSLLGKAASLATTANLKQIRAALRNKRLYACALTTARLGSSGCLYSVGQGFVRYNGHDLGLDWTEKVSGSKRNKSYLVDSIRGKRKRERELKASSKRFLELQDYRLRKDAEKGKEANRYARSGNARDETVAGRRESRVVYDSARSSDALSNRAHGAGQRSTASGKVVKRGATKPDTSKEENAQARSYSRVTTKRDTRQGEPRKKDGSKTAKGDSKKNPPPQWKVLKEALKRKFGEEGWRPQKRLSPDAMEGLRMLNFQDRTKYSIPVLAKEFKISKEAVRRILTSKWKPSPEEEKSRRRRFERSQTDYWSKMKEIGARVPKRWLKAIEASQQQDSLFSLEEPTTEGENV